MFSNTEILPNTKLSPNKPASQKFLAIGISGFRDAAKYVHFLPYGRTSNRTNLLLVLDEKKGTCSSKHALLALLARECSVSLDLMLGIYSMDGDNTNGVETVLSKYDLKSIPEAHCYLKYEARRIDITRVVKATNPISNFLLEKAIEPKDVSSQKVEIHQDFIRRWLENNFVSTKYSFDAIWKIREECISVL